MTANHSTQRQGDDAYLSLLQDPRVLVAALSPDGFRVPLPESLILSSANVLSGPTDRSTMIDLLVPVDALNVVGAWERAAASGMAYTDVHPGPLVTTASTNVVDQLVAVSGRTP